VIFHRMVEHDETRLVVVTEQSSRHLCVVSQLLVVEQAKNRLDTATPGPANPFGNFSLRHGPAGVTRAGTSEQNSRNDFSHRYLHSSPVSLIEHLGICRVDSFFFGAMKVANPITVCVHAQAAGNHLVSSLYLLGNRSDRAALPSRISLTIGCSGLYRPRVLRP